jgi:hypothetical protein
MCDLINNCQYKCVEAGSTLTNWSIDIHPIFVRGGVVAKTLACDPTTVMQEDRYSALKCNQIGLCTQRIDYDDDKGIPLAFDINGATGTGTILKAEGNSLNRGLKKCACSGAWASCVAPNDIEYTDLTVVATYLADVAASELAENDGLGENIYFHFCKR